VTPLKR